MRFIRDVQIATLDATGGANDERIVEMARQDRPFRELSIWCIPAASLARAIGSAAGVLDYSTEVFFGPSSQAAAAARANDEIFMPFDPGSTVRIWPANDLTSNPQQIGTRGQVRGFPISVRAINSAAEPVVLVIIFCAMTIDQG